MLSVNINNDIEKYKESVIGSFDARESLFVIAGFLVGAGSVAFFYFVCGLHIMICCYLSLLFVIPIIVAGFGRKDGMSFFQRIKKILSLKKIPYTNSRDYIDFEELERIEETNKKKKRIINGFAKKK
ncbi:MAG: PrgI family protein [Lachnospiraceae bacterium]|nr:PrgI family protein [Lachnospiraceae bacterium]